MSSNYDSLLSSEAFTNIHPKKKELIIEMLELMETRSSEQKLQILLAYGMKMQSEGLQLTTHESKALMDVLKTNMNPQEKSRVDMMINMMGMMK
ncbi:hypothetical protein [Vallitalea okinawensis]|uniref:hypothetical protein n=1 Tax=Vallitalea okinawensis TaxID=2078660 RepID=UPI000CFC8734|nr:hypothetical protein [Vallitalea okinawensis]